jgi:hypothetical protein
VRDEIGCVVGGFAYALGAERPAQPAGRIAGVLNDPSGAVVPGGEVTVRHLESSLSRMALSNARSGYVVGGSFCFLRRVAKPSRPRPASNIA